MSHEHDPYIDIPIDVSSIETPIDIVAECAMARDQAHQYMMMWRESCHDDSSNITREYVIPPNPEGLRTKLEITASDNKWVVNAVHGMQGKNTQHFVWDLESGEFTARYITNDAERVVDCSQDTEAAYQGIRDFAWATWQCASAEDASE